MIIVNLISNNKVKTFWGKNHSYFDRPFLEFKQCARVQKMKIRTLGFYWLNL